jgi:hypothetical protein
MRTRRIAIRCRRTGRSAAVAIGTTGIGLPADLPVPEVPPGLAVPPGYESAPDLALPPVYGVPATDPPQSFSVPAYLADPEPTAPAPGAGAPDRGGSAGPPAGRSGIRYGDHAVVNPWRSNRGPDLTPADILSRPGRRDLSWDHNPGWPAGIGWAYIARAARGPSPRHARGDARRWRVPGHVLVWAGLALLATALITLVADLLR